MTEQKIIEALQVLGAKLGVAAEHLYGVLVRQAYVEAGRGLFAIIPIVIFSILISKLYDKELSDCGDPTRHGVCLLICAFGLLVSSIALMTMLPEIFTGCLNPEYHAIREILGAVKQ